MFWCDNPEVFMIILASQTFYPMSGNWLAKLQRTSECKWVKPMLGDNTNNEQLAYR